MTNNTRRGFMIGGAALASLQMVPAAVAATRKVASRVKRDADVIVVGGGVSGLNTAWLLEQQGLKVVVLEGRQRVGGRVFTLFDEPGYPEMGFNSMGSGYGRGIDAAARAKVELVNLTPRFMLGARQELVLDGKVIRAADWATHPANPFPAPFKAVMPWNLVAKLVSERNPLKDWNDWTLPQSAPLDVSMYQFLKAQGLDDASIALAFDVAPYHGDSARDVSALMYEFSDGWAKSQMSMGSASYGVKGGNMHLPIGMAKLLKGDVLFGRTVTGVSSDATGASVTCSDGKMFHAKRVVLALPFSTARRIKIEPKLHGLQAEAVDTLHYQSISILFVRAETPFWDQDGLAPSMWTDSPMGSVTAQRFGATPEEVTGLMVQARGNLAKRWDAMPPEQLKQMVVAGIEAVRPAARGKLRATFLQSWALEPFNRGDWSVWGPGQISRFALEMSKPAGRVHFAGEHTATSNRGLEAAFESSERVALEILSA